MTEKAEHVSVFVREVEEQLDIQPDDLVLDATLGQGGHSMDILSRHPKVQLLGVDADHEAVVMSKEKLSKFDKRMTLVTANFKDIESVLKKEGMKSIDKAIFDLGWNTAQLDSGRGFSFMNDEPLSMSYGAHPASGFTAKEILNEWDEKTLADVFYGYGEEQYSRPIAKAIVERREFKPIETTLELAELIKDAVPAGYRHGRIHPATRTFQALRIAVNDELSAIEAGIEGTFKHLSCDGRIVVITFHSIEDRVVKRLLLKLAGEGGKLVVKKPLTPTREEITHNPRARSAKMRVIEKICKP